MRARKVLLVAFLLLWAALVWKLWRDMLVLALLAAVGVGVYFLAKKKRWLK